MELTDLNGVKHVLTPRPRNEIDFFYIKQRKLEAYYRKLKTGRQQERSAIRHILAAMNSIDDEERDLISRLF